MTKNIKYILIAICLILSFYYAFHNNYIKATFELCWVIIFKLDILELFFEKNNNKETIINK